MTASGASARAVTGTPSKTTVSRGSSARLAPRLTAGPPDCAAGPGASKMTPPTSPTTCSARWPPRHGRRRTEQAVTVETKRRSGRQYRANTLGQRQTCTPQQPPANESGLGQGDRRRVCSRGAEQLDRIGNAAPGSRPAPLLPGRH